MILLAVVALLLLLGLALLRRSHASASGARASGWGRVLPGSLRAADGRCPVTLQDLRDLGKPDCLIRNCGRDHSGRVQELCAHTR